MNTGYSKFVEEHDIDYDVVLRNGGQNCGDEDFAIFKCPFCPRIYLFEYEVDTVYPDARDLTKRIDVFNSGFVCCACGGEIPSESWAGPGVKAEYRVRHEDMLKSEWAWILNKRV